MWSNPMSLQRAAVATRPIFGRRCLTTLVHKSLRPVPKTSCQVAWPAPSRRLQSSKSVENEGGLGEKLQEMVCRVQGTLRYFNLWTILRKLGVPYCMIIQFRRKAKKIYYVTGLSTVVRASLPIIVGDILAQTVYHKIFSKKKKNTAIEEMKHLSFKDLKEVNWCRTSHFAVIGGFLIGPMAKRWNLFWGRRIRRYPPGAYLARVLILDAFLLTPFIVALYMAGYDWKYFKDHRKDLAKKEFLEKTTKRYETPFTDMVLFYITTKPVVALAACYVLPCALRNITRKLYSFIFYCFVSHTITHFKLGEEITNRKKKAGKKGNHYDGSGGFVCMAFDKMHDLVKSEKKK